MHSFLVIACKNGLLYEIFRNILESCNVHTQYILIFMLKKKERLSRNAFNRSFAVGKRMQSPSLQLIIDTTTSFHGSVVVPKKIFKKAVDRNTIRRQLYGVLYTFHKNNNIGKTYIVIVKPPIKNMTRSERALDLQQILQKTL